MRKIIVDLNVVKDNEFSMMYEMFGLDVQNKSYEDFERRMLQMSIETIIEVKNREQNLTSCAKWIFILEDIQQKSDCLYCIWGVYHPIFLLNRFLNMIIRLTIFDYRTNQIIQFSKLIISDHFYRTEIVKSTFIIKLGALVS